MIALALEVFFHMFQPNQCSRFFHLVSVSGDARWTAVASWLSERAVERQQHEAAPLQAPREHVGIGFKQTEMNQ